MFFIIALALSGADHHSTTDSRLEGPQTPCGHE